MYCVIRYRDMSTLPQRLQNIATGIVIETMAVNSANKDALHDGRNIKQEASGVSSSNILSSSGITSSSISIDNLFRHENETFPRKSISKGFGQSLIATDSNSLSTQKESISDIMASHADDETQSNSSPAGGKFKFSKKLLLQGIEGGSFPAAKQVSSQGCSRVFIVKGQSFLSDINHRLI